MDFSASLTYFDSLGLELRTDAKFELAWIARLLQALGNPQQKFASVHIAGTNGKGSVAAMLEAVLRRSGFLTGLYTSPHLERITERIQVAGREIAPADFARATTRVHEVIEALLTQGALPHRPSFFETMTAVGFVHLAEAGVNLAVVEVGLGGRLDATNVLVPQVSVITPVGMDHERFLGYTLPEIAGEKAGIIKPGVPVISGMQESETLAVLRARCEAQGAPLTEAEQPVPMPDADGRFHVTVAYRGEAVPLHPALRGRHQAGNAVTVAQVCEQLSAQHFPVPRAALQQGVAETVWPGRLEVVSHSPRIILDGAHNPMGARALADFLSEMQLRPVLVFGSLRDKDARRTAAILFPMAEHVILTAPDNPRAATAQELAEQLADHAAARPEALHVAADLPAALALAKQLTDHGARDERCIVVTGSLYLVGAARRLLLAGGVPA